MPKQITYKETFERIESNVSDLERKWRLGEYTSRQLNLEPQEVTWKMGVKYIATSSLDYSIKLWNRRTLECVETWTLNDNFVTC